MANYLLVSAGSSRLAAPSAERLLVAAAAAAAAAAERRRGRGKHKLTLTAAGER